MCQGIHRTPRDGFRQCPCAGNPERAQQHLTGGERRQEAQWREVAPNQPNRRGNQDGCKHKIKQRTDDVPGDDDK